MLTMDGSFKWKDLFCGGNDGSVKRYYERYDPLNDIWETLSPCLLERGVATDVLNEKIYAIGGMESEGVSKRRNFYPINIFSAGVPLPQRSLIMVTIYYFNE